MGWRPIAGTESDDRACRVLSWSSFCYNFIFRTRDQLHQINTTLSLRASGRSVGSRMSACTAALPELGRGLENHGLIKPSWEFAGRSGMRDSMPMSAFAGPSGLRRLVQSHFQTLVAAWKIMVWSSGSEFDTALSHVAI